MEQSDKRRLTSKTNMAKARQAKLDRLKKEREIRESLSSLSPPKNQDSSSESDYSSDEEVMYFNPPQSSQNQNQSSELSEIKRMLQNLTERKMNKKKEKVVYVQPQPIIQQPIVQQPAVQPAPQTNNIQPQYDPLKNLRWEMLKF